VRIESDPTGADIVIDGSPAGRTPRTTTLPVGSHRARLQKPGFRTAESVILIDPSRLFVLHAVLVPEPE